MKQSISLDYPDRFYQNTPLTTYEFISDYLDVLSSVRQGAGNAESAQSFLNLYRNYSDETIDYLSVTHDLSDMLIRLVWTCRLCVQ